MSESIKRTGIPALAKQVAIPLPMVPAPMMAAPLDRPHRCLLVDTGDLARRALREEHVAERRRFRRGHAFLEDFALLANSLIEGERQRHFDAFEARDRRPLAACLAPQTLAGGREDSWILQLRRALARERVRRPGGDPLLRKGKRAFQEVAVDHPVENSVLGCFCGADRSTVDDHRERRLHARKPRQALGAAGAGREAQRHLPAGPPRSSGSRPGSGRESAISSPPPRQ